MLPERCQQIKVRVKEIEAQLANPEDLLKHQQKYQSLTKELAQLRPVAEACDVIEQVDREIKDVKALLDGKNEDKELLDMYREEHEQFFFSGIGLLHIQGWMK